MLIFCHSKTLFLLFESAWGTGLIEMKGADESHPRLESGLRVSWLVALTFIE
ncbi:hypothetical protein GU272_09515 [Vibrio cholerae]|nr:hypothetical protein [Vibrio cholerae]NOE63979.1 hypothetical protein [Vibrio cholerae]NOF11417.1 hypothetical protein [Vibrio cholerae]